MKKSNYTIIAIIVTVLIITFNFFSCRRKQSALLEHFPEYVLAKDIQNHKWFNEERITILNYSNDVMEIGISPDGEFLLFNDNKKPDKDMHWSRRIDDRTYKYQGKVQNTVSKKVDGTPSFDGKGNIYFTTLNSYPNSFNTIFIAKFQDGVALDPLPVKGNIYVTNKNRPHKFWVTLDPDISDDGNLLFYSEGQFHPPLEFPYPYNVRGAKKVNGVFVKMGDRIFKNINTDNLEYAPAISSDGLEIFFTRVGKINGRLKMVGIFTAKRNTTNEPFEKPEKIMAITGAAEAPVLSGDETMIYYHRMDQGVFKAYRITRRQLQ